MAVKIPTEDEIRLYQAILKYEVEKFKKTKDFATTLLNIDELNNIILNLNLNNGNQLLTELINNKMIINLCDKYRTAHMALLAKAAHVRAYENDSPYALEYDIELKEEPFPDFEAHSFDEILKIIQDKLDRDGVSKNDVTLIMKIIKRILNEYDHKIKSVSSYQLYIIEQILSTDHKYIPLVAPTASGKTLAFTLPGLVYLLESVIRGEKPINIVFVYPRKALAKDQIFRLLKYVSIINDELKKYDKMITIALEDGDTPNAYKIRNGDAYRGLKCVKCGGDLIYNNRIIECKKCGHKYDYLIATREGIHKEYSNILVTNLWILYRRLLNRETVQSFKNIRYIVFDEIHAYDGIYTQHLKFILRLLESLKNLTKEDYINKIIFSSATIPDYKNFLTKIACCENENCIPEILSLEDYYKNQHLDNKKERIILYEFLFPNIERRVETLTEGVTQLALTWLKEYNRKGILFADSVSGVDTLYKYFWNTILGGKQGREIRDHLCYKDPKNLCCKDEYYWPFLAAYSKICGDDDELRNFAENMKNGIDEHYSLLSPGKRSEIEESFKKDKTKILLFSTSTLELGIDIGDVALVIQHKLPLSKESFIQRIGRAGRNENSYRIATGILILQSTPYASLYIYNDDLRNTLTNLNSKLRFTTINSMNIEIILQHIFSYILLKWAVKGGSTCVDDGNKYDECKDIARQLISQSINALASEDTTKELKKQLCIDLSDEDLKQTLKDTLMQLNDNMGIIINNENNNMGISQKIDEYINNTLNSISEAANYIEEQNTYELEMFDKKEIIYILNKSFEIVKEIQDSLYSGTVSNNSLKSLIQNLNIKLKNLENFNKKLDNIKISNSSNNLLDMINEKEKSDLLSNIKSSVEKALRNTEDLVKIINVALNKGNEKYLRLIGFISSFNKTLITQSDYVDVFTLLDKLFANYVFFSLLMLPPSPNINLLVDVDESDNNE